MNQYLNALAGRDPKRLPLEPDARYRENGVRLELGNGIWIQDENLRVGCWRPLGCASFGAFLCASLKPPNTFLLYSYARPAF